MPTRRPPKSAGPKPRTKPKRPIKRCERGHQQAWNWKGPWCTACSQEDAFRRTAEGAAQERREWQERLGPPPGQMIIPVGDGPPMVFGTGLARRQRRR